MQLFLTRLPRRYCFFEWTTEKGRKVPFLETIFIGYLWMIGKNAKNKNKEIKKTKRLHFQTRTDTCGPTNIIIFKQRKSFAIAEQNRYDGLAFRPHVSGVKRSAKTQLFQSSLPEWTFLKRYER